MSNLQQLEGNVGQGSEPSSPTIDCDEEEGISQPAVGSVASSSRRPEEQHEITMQQLLQQIEAMKTTNQKEREKLLSIEERVLHALGEHRDETTAVCPPLSSPPSLENTDDTVPPSTPSYQSLSYFSRLIFAFLFLPMSIGSRNGIWNILRVFCTSSLLLSVILAGFQNYFDTSIINKRSAIIGHVGWFINLIGAIIFIFAERDYWWDSDTYQTNPALQFAFGFLAVGHTLELVSKLLKTSQLKKKIGQILLAMLAISSFILLTVGTPHITIIVCPMLLVLHALIQYLNFVRSATATPSVTQDPDEIERLLSARQEPEALPDDMLDTFAFMVTSNDVQTWNFGFLIFFIQAGLSIMILIEQAFLSEPVVPLGVPSKVTIFLSFSQFWALLLAIFWQTDILTSIRMLSMLWYERNGNWPHEMIGAKDGKFSIWFDKVLLPNLLKLNGGILVLATSFVIIVKSEDIIDLFKDFTALILISEIDNIAFRLSNQGYFGKKLKNGTEKIKEIRLVDDSNAKIVGLPVRLFVLMVIFGSMIGGWAYFIHGQYSNRFLMMHYPKCNVTDNHLWLGDGRCNGEYNTEECGYDGGDCIKTNELYPNCTVDYLYRIGNGRCNGGDLNVEECGYDGGDCTVEGFPNCHVSDLDLFGDGNCDGGDYNTEECEYDGGDCTVEGYPDCHVDHSDWIGDGDCNGGEYNTEECDYDGGDCSVEGFPNCHVFYSDWIGDGLCHGEDYNTEECGFDGGDCIQFNEEYPNCAVEHPVNIGNGVCDDLPPYNTEECKFDGGDCTA